MKVKRILFPTDFSPCANAALVHAIFQAELNGAELHILHGVHWEEHHPVTRLPNADAIMFEMQKVARLQLEEMRKVHQDKPFNIIEKCVVGSKPEEVIIDYVQEHHIGLIVMGTHGRGALGHFFLGSMAEEIARLAPCPVITVRETGEQAELKPIKKILAPIDFSTQAKHALFHARELAFQNDAELILLHVVQEFERDLSGVDSGFSMMHDLMPKVVEKQKENLKLFFEEHQGKHVPFTAEVKVGRPAWRITEFAQSQNVDYIVMGTHGYNGFNHLILGSTTERVIRTAPCPVYSLKVRQ